MRLCTVPGCDRKHLARGLCSMHYKRAARAANLRPRPTGPRGLLGSYQGEDVPKSSTLTLWPARPARVTDALHALAETPGLTTSEYERKKAQILEGDHA